MSFPVGKKFLSLMLGKYGWVHTSFEYPGPKSQKALKIKISMFQWAGNSVSYLLFVYIPSVLQNFKDKKSVM